MSTIDPHSRTEIKRLTDLVAKVSSNAGPLTTADVLLLTLLMRDLILTYGTEKLRSARYNFFDEIRNYDNDKAVAKRYVAGLIAEHVISFMTTGKWTIHPASLQVWVEREMSSPMSSVNVKAVGKRVYSKTNTMLKERNLANSELGICNAVLCWAGTDAGPMEMYYIAKLFFNLLSTKEGK